MKLLFNRIQFIQLLFITTVFLLGSSSCKKADSIDPVAFFNANVLDKNLTIHLATDNGVNVTSNYSAYTFKCATGGVFTATNNLFTINGTWAVNADYGKLTITLPTPPSEFIFLNREWIFTKYTTPIMELGYSATAGGEYKILHFQKQ